MTEYRFEDLEPTAARAANVDPNGFSIATIAAFSAAISLKRIADQLDGTASGINILDLLKRIEMNGRMN